MNKNKNYTKKIKYLLSFFIIVIFLLKIINIASAVEGFIVLSDSSNKVLITDGTSQYVIEHSYECYDSDFYEGALIYIDSYFYPSYGDTIIIPDSYSNTTCEITDSEEVNIKEYYVDKVLDSSDNVLVTDRKKGRQYLVEYGLGCGLSFWRYEGKTIHIDIGGSFLDGIGDRIYLFNSDRDCRVWDAEELSPSSTSPPINYENIDLFNNSCPLNSQYLNNKCICEEDYSSNEDKNACITYTQVCQNKYGASSYGDKEYCYCSDNYEFNASKTTCVKKQSPKIPEGALIRSKDGIDIYIVKYSDSKKFKRLILTPRIFNMYGHLKWENVLVVDKTIIDSFMTSTLVKVAGDSRVWKLYPKGDIGEKRWVKNIALLGSSDWDKDSIYEINIFDRDSYTAGEDITQ